MGFGVATLPNASRLWAVMRVVSAVGSSRALCGLIEMAVTGPAVPVAENFTVVPTPDTVAVTSLGPTIVPRVHNAVACPFESVVASRGFVEPLPSVTARATVAPCTGRPPASVTLTTIPPATAVPTAAVRARSATASRWAGG